MSEKQQAPISLSTPAHPETAVWFVCSEETVCSEMRICTTFLNCVSYWYHTGINIMMLQNFRQSLKTRNKKYNIAHLLYDYQPIINLLHSATNHYSKWLQQFLSFPEWMSIMMLSADVSLILPKTSLSLSNEHHEAICLCKSHTA
jgi:hypothetical protein